MIAHKLPSCADNLREQTPHHRGLTIYRRIPRKCATESKEVRRHSMFEESMIESQIAHASATKQWTIASSIAFQTVLAIALITLPLIHPEGLVFHKETPLVFTPPLPPHPVIPVARSQSSSP